MKSALKTLKPGKASDAKGLVAEMLKSGGDMLRHKLLELVSEIISPGASTPLEWHRNILKVLFKGGDAAQAKNYRPTNLCAAPLVPIVRNLVVRVAGARTRGKP